MKSHFVLSAALALYVTGAVYAQPNTGGMLKGKVVDEQGNTVPNATVVCFDAVELSSNPGFTPNSRVTVTNGVFEVELGAPSGLLIAKAPGQAWTWTTVRPQAGDTGIQIPLTAPADLAGQVVDDSGKPCPGIEVFVLLATMEAPTEGGGQNFSFITGDPAREKFKARTDSAGRFAIADFPKGAQAALGIEAPNKTLSIDGDFTLSNLPHKAGQTDIRLTLAEAGNIEGKVVFPGQFIPAAVVRLDREASGASLSRLLDYTAECSADGSFVVKNAAPGSYKLTAALKSDKGLAEYAPTSIPVRVEAGKTNRDVKIEMSRGGLLEVTVVDRRTRAPITNAIVRTLGQGPMVKGVSGADGKALLRLGGGTHQVFASSGSGGGVNGSAVVEEGKTNQVEMEMLAPRVIQGVVRYPDGKPASGLNVQVIGSFASSGKKPVTAEDGSFELQFQEYNSGHQSRPCMLVRDPKHNVAAAEEIDDDTEKVELKLLPGLSIVGRAECDGSPVTNATATLVFWSGNMGMHLQSMESPDMEPGKFEIKALPPGRRYGLYVSGKGYGQKYVDLANATEENNQIDADLVEIRRANLKLGGQVVDADEKPVRGASLHISGDSQPNKNVTSDKDGNFLLEGVCEGPIRIYANAGGLQGSLSAEGGETNVVVRLGEMSGSGGQSGVAHKLAGIVKGPGGAHARDVQISVFPSGGTSRKSGTNGAFNLTWRLESWQMDQGGDGWLIARDLQNNLAAAEVISEEVTNLVVQLSPGITITGKVLGADGEALKQADVGLWILAGRSYETFDSSAVKVEDGKFQIKGLPHGPKYIVYASAKDYGRSQQEVEMDADARTIEMPEFKLNPANMMIAGQVLRPDEKPAAGVQINISGENQPQTSTTTDKQGMFKLKVCEGKVRVYAHAQDSYGNMEVEAGDTNVVLNLRGYNSVASDAAPRRASLTGKPLPDLAPFGIAAESTPAGKPLLVCLLDAEQRPSRRSARVLAEQQETLKGKGVGIVAIQTASISAETMQSWTNSAPLGYPVGCIGDKSSTNRWASDVQSLPWLILRDAKGNVVAEGFTMEELDAKLDALPK